MSPRTGRPKSDNPKSALFSIRFDEETEKLLRDYCEANNVTKSEAVRRGVHLLAKSNKKK